ncbi:MAG: peptide ABC transporter ATP-binding protein, partial [Alphaproteobacteria bacterium]|nr:peptide ABC transporter ATP-binding protein [Alphaproteobacteria bacterium]
SVVEHIADRVAVMYLGTLVEVASRDRIWRSPQHPYTKALLEVAPVANPKLARTRRRTVLQGELPSPIDPPAGCPFHSRCPIAQDRCKVDTPALRPLADGTLAACHFI